MKYLNFSDIDNIAIQARNPLDDKFLENFQADYFGEFRHWYYRFFYHLAAETKPKLTLEIGVHHCHCMIHMATANASTISIGIDKNIKYAQPGFDKYASDNCILINEDSLIGGEMAIKKLVKQYGKIGIVFQDSSHHYNDSHREFKIYSEYLDDHAIWCCDDVMSIFHDPAHDPPGKSMESYFNELPGDKRLYNKLHHGSVIGVILL